MAFDLGDYKDVPTRIVEFREKHPEGSLRPLNPSEPYRIEAIGGQTFVVYVAAAFRTPDDPSPGVGAAWEPFPGKTSYTRDSELQNAETSAWGRAIVAALTTDSKGRIASREEVRNQREVPMADVGAVRALGERLKERPTSERDAIKQKMAEAGLSFTEALTQAELDTIESWAAEIEDSVSTDTPTREGGTAGEERPAKSPPSPAESYPAAPVLAEAREALRGEQ